MWTYKTVVHSWFVHDILRMWDTIWFNLTFVMDNTPVGFCNRVSVRRLAVELCRKAINVGIMITGICGRITIVLSLGKE